MGTPRCGRPADYLPSGTVGQWPPATRQRWAVQKERRPENRPSDERGRLGPRAGIPKENEAQLPQKGTLLPPWVLYQGEGPQRPHCVKGRGLKDFGVAAPLPAAGCCGNCFYVMGGRSGLLAGLMDNAFCRASAYSSTTGPLDGGSACVSPFAGTQEDLLDGEPRFRSGADAVFSFVSEHQTIEEFWKTAFVTFALRTASLDGSRHTTTAASIDCIFPSLDLLFFCSVWEKETLDPNLHPDSLGVPAQTLQTRPHFCFRPHDLIHYVSGIGVELCRTTFWICGGHSSVSAPQLFVIVRVRALPIRVSMFSKDFDSRCCTVQQWQTRSSGRSGHHQLCARQRLRMSLVMIRG